MSEKIEPALTPEEWAQGWKASVRRHHGTVEVFDIDLHPEELHATAALCLHGQTFGFTHEDVRWHRELARQARTLLRDANAASMARDPGNIFIDGSLAQRASSARASAEWHTSMADRIEALLPPRESK